MSTENRPAGGQPGPAKVRVGTHLDGSPACHLLRTSGGPVSPRPPETPMASPISDPISELQEHHYPESYWPDEYLESALPLLSSGGWLARPIDDHDRVVVKRVLEGLNGIGLDVTDVFPFGLIWALRSVDVVAGSPDLDADLAGWRRWEETDHLGEPMDFLPEIGFASDPGRT